MQIQNILTASPKAYIQLTRPVNVLITFISIFVGGAVTGTIKPLEKLLLACVSAALITAGANAINDYFDVEIDRINKPDRPIPSGRVGLRPAFWFSSGLFLTGILLSLFIHLTALVICLMTSICLYLYSYHLKRTVLWGNVTVAFFSGLAFVYGGLAVGRFQTAFIVGIFSFLFHLAREILKDIEDVKGDKADGVVTLPICHGVNAALILGTAILCLLILLTFIPYVLHIFSFRYLVIVFFGVDLFLVYVLFSIWKNRSSGNAGRLAALMKVDMIIGLLAVFWGRM